jgi:hypothetical protein
MSSGIVWTRQSTRTSLQGAACITGSVATEAWCSG